MECSTPDDVLLSVWSASLCPRYGQVVSPILEFRHIYWFLERACHFGCHLNDWFARARIDHANAHAYWMPILQISPYFPRCRQEFVKTVSGKYP